MNLKKYESLRTLRKIFAAFAAFAVKKGIHFKLESIDEWKNNNR
jgi:hypothetical protein